MARERLHKVLAQNGVGSRRDCETLIAEGRVSVDGETVSEQGLLVDIAKQTIKVDGTRVKSAAPVYLLLNKPAGYVCTMAEDEKVPRAVDLAPKGAGRVHTVGRLDKESEGLILLTNDGDLTERLTHPRHDFPKVYHVKVKGPIPGEALAKLKKGVWLSEGKTHLSALRVLRHVPHASFLEVELREGLNRELRRVFAKVGHGVLELRRVAIGPLKIAGLPLGKTRFLTDDEVALLEEAIGRREPRAGAAGDARGARGGHGRTAGDGARGDADRNGGARAPEQDGAGAKAGKGPGGAAKAGSAGPGGKKAGAAQKAATGLPGAKNAKRDADRSVGKSATKPDADAPERLRGAGGAGPIRRPRLSFDPIKVVKTKGGHTVPVPLRPERATSEGADDEAAAAAPRAPSRRGAGPVPSPRSGAPKAASSKDAPTKGASSTTRSPSPEVTASQRLSQTSDPPADPPAPRPAARYEPDEDGVIVVRRPSTRFLEEE